MTMRELDGMENFEVIFFKEGRDAISRARSRTFKNKWKQLLPTFILARLKPKDQGLFFIVHLLLPMALAEGAGNYSFC